MGKCRYDLSEDCHNTDCLNCVLDKIRAEIEEQKKERCFDDDMFVYRTGLDDALYIIDKYRGEGKDADTN